MSEMTAANGKIQESNFNGYQVARMPQAPRMTHVHLVASTAAPAGVGEPGVPPIAPAICNAVFAATGKRVPGTSYRCAAEAGLSRILVAGAFPEGATHSAYKPIAASRHKIAR